ncbi:uncharacterized protein NPIL_294641 [Nephila pilipes]|uniref:Peptidase aspartic putative domain-containing protein n=1 Tax=Nephila pilipes TaxID=299642 RepID=A0A8X6P3T9_NEPPI|nr:uncharacterized protein NPIL_294641 [Nephila pilipes]
MEDKKFILRSGFGETSGEKKISILVGADFYCSLTKCFEGLNSSLIVVNTELGWSFLGKCGDVNEFTSVNLVLGDRNFMSAELRLFWKLESSGNINKETKEDYNRINDEYRNEGIVEESSSESEELCNEPPYYLFTKLSFVRNFEKYGKIS